MSRNKAFSGFKLRCREERRQRNKTGLLTVALIGVHCKHPGAAQSNARNGSVSKKPMGVLNCVATMPSTTSAPELLSVTMYRTCTVSAGEHHSKFVLDRATSAPVLLSVTVYRTCTVQACKHHAKYELPCPSLAECTKKRRAYSKPLVTMQSSLPCPSKQRMVAFDSQYLILVAFISQYLTSVVFDLLIRKFQFSSANLCLQFAAFEILLSSI